MFGTILVYVGIYLAIGLVVLAMFYWIFRYSLENYPPPQELNFLGIILWPILLILLIILLLSGSGKGGKKYGTETRPKNS